MNFNIYPASWVKVAGTALTVGGPTFIGSWQDVDDKAAADALNTNAYTKANLFVTRGIATESFMQLPNTKWKDIVFPKGFYSLKLSSQDKLSKITNFINLNDGFCLMDIARLLGLRSDQNTQNVKKYLDKFVSKGILKEVKREKNYKMGISYIKL